MSKQDWCNIPISYQWSEPDEFYAIRTWLSENVSYLDYIHAGADSKDYSRNIVFFAKERDAVQFALRWL